MQFTLTANERPGSRTSDATAGADFTTANLPLTVTVTPCTIDGGDGPHDGSIITADHDGENPWSSEDSLTQCRDRQNDNGELVVSAAMAFRALLGDDLPERNEIFYVSLYSAVNVAFQRNAFEVTIVDDDLPAVSVADVTVDESAAAATLTLTLDVDPVVFARVDWATAVARPVLVGAVPDEDFRPTSGTARFFRHLTTRTVTVPLRDDSVDEPDEVFLLVLSSPSGLVIGDAVAVVTIVDDDPGWWVRADASDAEDAGTLRFVVERDHTGSAPFTLRYSIDAQAGTATGGDDCATAGVDFVTPSGSVVVPADATEAVIDITVCDDSQVESRETLVLELDNVEGRDLVGVGTIVDNDVGDP